MTLPAIFGLAGAALSADERDFFRDADPAGYILFGRNCVDRGQLRGLTDSLRALHGRALPILIDQEGGRVARLRPPCWPEFPAGERFDALYRVAPVSAIEAARANALAIAALLREAGITVDCLPLLDLRHAETHAAIADRTLGAEPMQVAALGRAVIDGLRAGGIVAVVKHLPGQGRASRDSHVERPVVTADAAALETDLEPFRKLADAPMGMVAHVVYAAWDPDLCASASPIVIGDVIRTRIGFDGWLMSDDIAMEALSGSQGDRARSVVDAGCDAALHCSGDMMEMVAVADALDAMAKPASQRLARAMASIADVRAQSPYAELAEKRDRLLAFA
jgi:beta-N-acetylhexosaminidase